MRLQVVERYHRQLEGNEESGHAYARQSYSSGSISEAGCLDVYRIIFDVSGLNFYLDGSYLYYGRLILTNGRVRFKGSLLIGRFCSTIVGRLYYHRTYLHYFSVDLDRL